MESLNENAMIVAHLISCIKGWRKACKTITNTFFSFQKNAVPFVTRQYYSQPLNTLFIS